MLLPIIFTVSLSGRLLAGLPFLMETAERVTDMQSASHARYAGPSPRPCSPMPAHLLPRLCGGGWRWRGKLCTLMHP